MPRVTVISVTYNAGLYLAPAVESVLAQTYGDFEYLLVDNACTDGSVQSLRESSAGKDPRLRILHLAENRYQGGGWQAARDEARGDFVALLDSDDRWHPAKLERQVALLDSHPDLSGAATLARRIDAEGRPGSIEFTLGSPESFRAFTAYSTGMITSTLCLRREAWMACLGRGALPPFTPDFDLIARAAEWREGLTTLPEVLTDYRWHPTNTTQRHQSTLTACACAVRWVTARRRAGRPEDADAIYGAIRRMPAGTAPIFAACSAQALSEGLLDLAVYCSRQLVRASRGTAFLSAARTALAAIGRAPTREARVQLRRLWLRGPLVAHGLRPLTPESKVSS